LRDRVFLKLVGCTRQAMWSDVEFFVKSTLQSIKRGVRFPSASPPPVRDVITVGHGELSKKVCLDGEGRGITA
jgi:hypothetical protein